MPALAIGCGGGGGAAATSGWQRNPDWLAMPTMTDGISQELFAGLYLIFDCDTNYVWLRAQGDYTVDWGDGNVENFSSDAVAEHNFAWADCGGEFSNNGTTCRQALIKVYPQAGQHLTLLSLDEVNATFVTDGYGYWSAPWLDLAVIGENLATLNLGNGVRYNYTEICERVIVKENSLTTGEKLCQYFYNLAVAELDTVGWTSFNSMFYLCYSLLSVRFTDTSAVTDCDSMFYFCRIQLPLFDTSNVLNFSNMNGAIEHVYDIPAYDMSSATAIDNILYGTSLKRFRAFGATVNLGLQYNMLSRTALVEVFTNLGTTVTGVLDITGNYGVADLTAEDLAIATDKGWTITS